MPCGGAALQGWRQLVATGIGKELRRQAVASPIAVGDRSGRWQWQLWWRWLGAFGGGMGEDGHDWAGFATVAGAGPLPRFRGSREARFHGIIFDVAHDFAEVFVVADVAVEVVVQPEGAAAAQQLVGFFGGVALEALENVAERDIPEFEQGVKVVGHDDPGVKAVLDAIVVPIGGAGLIAGIALATKELAPRVKIVGVEPSRCASFAAAMAAGKPVRVSSVATLADGLAVPEVGSRSFEIARTRVDECVAVDENAIALAILRLAELEKGVVEGAGAAPLAAFLAGKLDSLKGKRVALVLCGGNIDPLVFSRVIEQGLAVDGRLVKFSAVISDRPGGLADLAGTLAKCGASVQDIVHERTFGEADVSTVTVQCIVEVRDRSHAQELFQALHARGVRITSRSDPLE